MQESASCSKTVSVFQFHVHSFQHPHEHCRSNTSLPLFYIMKLNSEMIEGQNIQLLYILKL